MHVLSHFDFPYKCSACSMYFKNKEEESSHRQEKHKRTFDCSTCGRSYMHAAGLRAHVSISHKTEELRSYSCTKCKKVFPTKSRLKVHMAVHSNVRPFTCEQCGTSFKTLDTLKTHITYIHEGIPRKPYKKVHTCEFCGAEFNGSSVLREHILIRHTENAVFKHKCELCEKSFPRAHRLEAHVNKEHLNRKPYLCNFCGKSFFILMDCNRHKERCPKSKLQVDKVEKPDDAVSNEHCDTDSSIGTVYGSVMQTLQGAL